MNKETVPLDEIEKSIEDAQDNNNKGKKEGGLV